MQPYKNLSGDSGVVAYEIRENGIAVQFELASYLYTNDVSGRLHVSELQKLALAGQGLSTYIAKNRRTLKYELKW